MPNPPTVHDFGGFPRELYEIQYPAPGNPVFAAELSSSGQVKEMGQDNSWGLDHGTWSVLAHVYPKADIPVVQLSIDRTKSATFHFDIGQRLAPLRDEGILIFGSGNLVHNLRAYAWGQTISEPYDWAARFETEARQILVSGDHKPLIEYEKLGPDARLAIPTAEHYLPLLYVLALQQPQDTIRFFADDISMGSLSMRSVWLGSISLVRVSRTNISLFLWNEPTAVPFPCSAYKWAGDLKSFISEFSQQSGLSESGYSGEPSFSGQPAWRDRAALGPPLQRS